MPFVPKFLLEARHVHQRVRTADDYRAAQRAHIVRNREAYPALAAAGAWSLPWPHVGGAVWQVSGGYLQIRCACGNAPAIDLEWRLACCFECGAVFENLVPPDDFDAIRTALLARPNPQNRHWLPGETLDDLLRENAEHGIGEAA